MAKECFCGCGLPVRGIKARISKRGAGTLGTVQALKLYYPLLQHGADDGSDSCRQGLEQLQDFCNEGESLAEELAQVVHGDRPPTDIDRQQLAAWQRTSIRVMADYRSYPALRRTWQQE